MDYQDFAFKRIMVVDDAKIDRYIASHVIKRNSVGQEVIIYDAASSAIEYLDAHQTNPEALPEVILWDMSMPEIDGFQFLEKLSASPQTLRRSCCIIMVSPDLTPIDYERASNIPIVKKFVTKPLKKADLDEVKELYAAEIMTAFV